jgi:Tfp pilus assembly protein PilX
MCNRCKRRQQRGFALVACLGVVVVTAILVLMFFSFTEATQQAARKRRYQDRGEEQIEAKLSAVHSAIEANLRANAQVEISGLSSDTGQSAGDLKDGIYNVTMAAESSQSVIEATETHNSRRQLTDRDDPFRGATASTIDIDVTGTANRLGATKPNGDNDYLSLSAHPVLSIRQIPLSEFSVYSGGGNIALNATATPNIGRIYVNGNLNISGGIANSSYPVTTFGDVILSGGAGLEARSSPNAAPIALPMTSTADDKWPSLAKSTQESTVLTGRDLPMSMVQATSKDELTAPPLPPNKDQQKDRLRLWRQCSRVISENAGKITVTGGASDEEENYKVARTQIDNAWGPPIIVFDAAKIAPGAGKTSFYIGSTSSTAAVYVINAGTLTGDLTIVTPHPILISGGFNAQGAPHAASLITAQRVFAVP